MNQEIPFVYLLTEQQKNNLIGQLVEPDWYFYPVQDCFNNWVISPQEVDGSIYEPNEWVKQLPKIEWCAPPEPDPF